MKVIIDYRLLVGLLLVLATRFGALAQLQIPPARDTAHAQPAPDDRSPITVRQPATRRLDAYRNNRDYQYGQDLRPGNSPWAKFWAWFWQKIGAFLSSKSYENFWQYVFLTAAACAVGWLLLRAQVLGAVFTRKSQPVDLPYETLTENIHEIDFDRQIEVATEQRNYRLAVRLLYLQTLKHLSNRNLIDWKPNKTNRSYVYELAQSPLKPEFETLTTQFEYIWYGDFPITEERFTPLREAFRRFGR